MNKRQTVITTATIAAVALAQAPQAAADHQTIGGGRFQVLNSDNTCTAFRAGIDWYTMCPGGFITVRPGGSYISVPLGAHAWVECDTYTSTGQLFEHEIEYAADVPRKQQFWAAKDWDPYLPEALCQMW